MSGVSGLLRDGFSTLITLGSDGEGGTDLFEKEVTPPSYEGGGPIDITTMRNNGYRTRAPKQLLTLGQASFVAAYDPVCYDTLLDIIQDNVQITVLFPDGGSLTFWGWLDQFKPSQLKEGDQPTAECVIEPSNVNASWVETGPSFSGATLTSIKRFQLAKKKYAELTKRLKGADDVDVKKVVKGQ